MRMRDRKSKDTIIEKKKVLVILASYLEMRAITYAVATTNALIFQVIIKHFCLCCGLMRDIIRVD